MKDIDLGLDEREHMRYQVNKDGTTTHYTDKRFHPSQDNFNNLVGSNNFTRFFLDCSEEVEWRQSERYKNLVKKLMEDGIAETKRLIKIKNEFTLEAWKEYLENEINISLKRIESDNDCGGYYKCKYEQRKDQLNNLNGSWQERIDYYMTGTIGFKPQCSLDYKIALYYAVFCKGVENFIEITRECGHVVNGVQIIDYISSSDGEYREHFYVKEKLYIDKFFY